MKLRVGDTVIVIAGSEKGKTGKILKINHKTNRIIVEDVNKVTKHKRGVKLGYRFEDGKKVRFNKKTGETIKEQKRQEAK